MITTLLSVLALAALFALFGWVGAADDHGGCAQCHHAGSPDCDASCPLLREFPEPSQRPHP